MTNSDAEHYKALVDESREAFNRGDEKECFLLLDQAIALLKENNKPAFGLEVHKELLVAILHGTDHSPVIAVMKQALDYYRQKGERLEQIQYLHDLASEVSFHNEDHQQALRYLDGAQSILDSFTPEYIQEFLRTRPSYDEVDIWLIIEGKKAMLSKQRQYVEYRIK